MKVKLLLAVLMLAIIIAGSVLLTQEVFRVRGVVVLGCEERAPQEVTSLSGIGYEESIFKVDMDVVKQNVEMSPYYQVQDTRILYPDRIQITVHERRPRAIIEYLGGIIVMDEQGYILETRRELGAIRCPVVTGMMASAFTVGQKVASADPMQVNAMQAVLEEMIAQDCAQMISELNVKDVQDIRMMTRDGFEVQLGAAEDLESKIRLMRSVVPSFAAEGHVGGSFYMVTVRSAAYQPPGSGQSQPVDVDGLPDPDQGAEGEEEPQEGTPEETDPNDPTEGAPGGE